jgi:hypothetical protein
LKKPTGSVRFRFFKPETRKTKPNPNQKNRKKTEPKPSQTEKTEPNRKKTEPKPEKPSQT